MFSPLLAVIALPVRKRDENGRLYKVIKKSDIQAGSEIKAGRLDVVISGSNDKTV